MDKKKAKTQLPVLFRAAVSTLSTYPIILYPLCVVAFLQLLALEILYFSPRYPLSVFFAPLIKRIWSEVYLHFPANFILLPKLFYYSQITIYIFVGSFLSAVAISIIAAINNGKKASFKSSFRGALKWYPHIVMAGILSLILFFAISSAYHFILNNIVSIESTGKKILFLKKALVFSEPYMDLFLGVIANLLLVFVVPIIVIEGKKIFSAIKLNMRLLVKNFWFMFCVIFIPTLFYVPVLLLRNNFAAISDKTLPVAQLIFLVSSVLVTMFIDAVVFTATTSFYLLTRENK